MHKVPSKFIAYADSILISLGNLTHKLHNKSVVRDLQYLCTLSSVLYVQTYF